MNGVVEFPILWRFCFRCVKTKVGAFLAVDDHPIVVCFFLKAFWDFTGILLYTASVCK